MKSDAKKQSKPTACRVSSILHDRYGSNANNLLSMMSIPSAQKKPNTFVKCRDSANGERAFCC